LDRKSLLKTLNLSRFTAFDFEPTGLEPYNDRIIEIAAIRFEDGEIKDRYVELINPERPISRMITEITGISGLINSTYRSFISPSSNRIAAISMIRSL
jgi:DNA polymerase III epsilon subunit-like protein